MTIKSDRWIRRMSEQPVCEALDAADGPEPPARSRMSEQPMCRVLDAAAGPVPPARCRMSEQPICRALDAAAVPPARTAVIPLLPSRYFGQSLGGVTGCTLAGWLVTPWVISREVISSVAEYITFPACCFQPRSIGCRQPC